MDITGDFLLLFARGGGAGGGRGGGGVRGEGQPFHDFLFSSRHNNSFRKTSLPNRKRMSRSLGSTFFHYRVDSRLASVLITAVFLFLFFFCFFFFFVFFFFFLFCFVFLLLLFCFFVIFLILIVSWSKSNSFSCS